MSQHAHGQGPLGPGADPHTEESSPAPSSEKRGEAVLRPFLRERSRSPYQGWVRALASMACLSWALAIKPPSGPGEVRCCCTDDGTHWMCCRRNEASFSSTGTGSMEEWTASIKQQQNKPAPLIMSPRTVLVQFKHLCTFHGCIRVHGESQGGRSRTPALLICAGWGLQRLRLWSPGDHTGLQPDGLFLSRHKPHRPVAADRADGCGNGTLPPQTRWERKAGCFREQMRWCSHLKSVFQLAVAETGCAQAGRVRVPAAGGGKGWGHGRR